MKKLIARILSRSLEGLEITLNGELDLVIKDMKSGEVLSGRKVPVSARVEAGKENRNA